MARRKAKLTAEEMKIINSNFTDEELINKFIRDCNLKNLRPATLKYYLSELSSFKLNLSDLGIKKSFSEITQEDIEIVILALKNQIKIVSINTRLRAIKAFFNYLERNSLVTDNPTKNIKNLRDREKIMETLNDEEIVQVANHIKSQNSFVGVRDYAIFLIFIDTGIRLSELCGLRVQDVRKNQIVIRMTKNLHERTVFPSEKTQRAVRDYMRLRGSLHHDWLFVNNEDEPLKKRSIQTRFEKYKEELQFKKQLSPHILRHTYAKRSIISGMDAFSLAKLLGHSDLSITKRYVNLWGHDLEEMAKKYSSINKLKI